MKALHVALMSLLLSACGIASDMRTSTPIPTQPSTATSTPSLTPTPDVNHTQIAIMAATMTEQVAKANATRTEESNKAASLLEEIKRASDQAEGPDLSNAKLVFGPAHGSLAHELDGKVKSFHTDVSLKNFITSVTFVNPYDTSTTGNWDYGILFRNEHHNNQYRLIVLSNRSWVLTDARSWTHLFSKNDKFIQSEAGEENTIWLAVVDTKAYLFINGAYTQTLNVSGKLTAGDVSPATGLYAGNEKSRKTTKFHDFFVWSLP